VGQDDGAGQVRSPVLIEVAEHRDRTDLDIVVPALGQHRTVVHRPGRDPVGHRLPVRGMHPLDVGAHDPRHPFPGREHVRHHRHPAEPLDVGKDQQREPVSLPELNGQSGHLLVGPNLLFHAEDVVGMSLFVLAEEVVEILVPERTRPRGHGPR
jgi:hypothetical protein